MSVIVPIVSDIQILADMLGAQSFRLKLFKNNYTPVVGSVLGSFTEANFSGYAAAIVTAGGWSTPVNDGTGRAISNNALFTFSNTTGAVGNDIYGYFVTDAGGTKLYWAERFGVAPVDMNSAGKVLNVIPVLTQKSEF